MIDNDPINVITAFEILIEEIEAELEVVNDHGSKAFQAGDYPAAQEAIATAKKITEFRQRVASLRRDWIALAHGAPTSVPLSPTRASEAAVQLPAAAGTERRQKRVHLKKGLKTPQEEYRLPILRVLQELGGGGKVSAVLERVHRLMKPKLNEFDHQPLRSNPNTVRWYNTAQWCRNTMVAEGLLKDDSPHGVWEISERGRRELQRMGS